MQNICLRVNASKIFKSVSGFCIIIDSSIYTYLSSYKVTLKIIPVVQMEIDGSSGSIFSLGEIMSPERLPVGTNLANSNLYCSIFHEKNMFFASIIFAERKSPVLATSH